MGEIGSTLKKINAAITGAEVEIYVYRRPVAEWADQLLVRKALVRVCGHCWRWSDPRGVYDWVRRWRHPHLDTGAGLCDTPGCGCAGNHIIFRRGWGRGAPEKIRAAVLLRAAERGEHPDQVFARYWEMYALVEPTGKRETWEILLRRGIDSDYFREKRARLIAEQGPGRPVPSERARREAARLGGARV